MTLQQKIFRAGIELTSEELETLARVEALLRENADKQKTADLAVEEQADLSDLAIDEV